MSDLYILDGHEPKPADNISEWGRWFHDADRHVGLDMVADVRVSTVFLGVNHNFSGGAPLLFETMVFGGEHDQFTMRYSTWQEAEAGHARTVAMVRDPTP